MLGALNSPNKVIFIYFGPKVGIIHVLGALGKWYESSEMNWSCLGRRRDGLRSTYLGEPVEAACLARATHSLGRSPLH